MVMRKNSTPERFSNRKEALLWLQSRGQISQGKFYQDCAAGLLTISHDKSLSKFQVAEYADKVFSFARQKPLLKAVHKLNRRSSRPFVGLLSERQGGSVVVNAEAVEMVDSNTGIKGVEVVCKFDTPNHTINDQKPGRGSINAALSLTFTGNIQHMSFALQNIPQDLINGAITGALIEMLIELSRAKGNQADREVSECRG